MTYGKVRGGRLPAPLRRKLARKASVASIASVVSIASECLNNNLTGEISAALDSGPRVPAWLRSSQPNGRERRNLTPAVGQAVGRHAKHRQPRQSHLHGGRRSGRAQRLPHGKLSQEIQGCRGRSWETVGVCATLALRDGETGL